MRISREKKKLKAVLVSSRSGEHPVEEVSYDSGDFKMKIKRSYEGQGDWVYDYDGALSTSRGLRGSVTITEVGGQGRSSTGSFQAVRMRR